MKPILTLLTSYLLFSTAFAQVDTLVVAINNAPWVPGFEALAEQYEADTGVEIDLRIFPFAQLNDRARNAVAAPESEFDIITIAELGTAFFYAGDLVVPFTEVDPNFELDPAILEYNGLLRWDEEANFSSPDGQVRALPINGNIQLFFYRQDLYEEAGLEPPETWEDVMNAAEVIAGDDRGLFGYANRGQRSTASVSYDFYPFLRGMGGRIFADPPNDWTVVLDSPEAVAALELYLELADNYSPPNVASIGQAEQIALLTSGNLLQTIVVAGAFADMDNPERSVVPGEMAYTVVPRPVDGVHASNSGVLVQAIPHNLPPERQQAALDFLEYATSFEGQMTFARGGGVPTRQDVYESELADDPDFRYLAAMAESAPFVVNRPRIPEANQYQAVLELHLSEAVAGQLSAEEAIRQSAQEIEEIMREAGYLE